MITGCLLAASTLLAASGPAPLCEPQPALHTTIEDADSVSDYSSMVVPSDGLPVIAHFDFTTAALKVAKCGSADCSTGTTVTAVDDPDNVVGFFPSIAVGSDGLPVISYLDATAGSLKVAKCGNPACTDGNTIAVVDEQADHRVGIYASLAIGADGLPVISYHAEAPTGLQLRVAKCGNPGCTAANVITTVDGPPNSVGILTAIAVGPDGLPVISYQDMASDAIKVAKCGNPSCSAGNTLTTVDDEVNPLFAGDIAIGSDGLPVLSYYEFDKAIEAGALKVAKCGNAACTAGNGIVTVDHPLNTVGAESSMVIDSEGRPVISHIDATANALKVARCGDGACSAGNVLTTVDNPVNAVGWRSSLALGLDGRPVISHSDTTSLKLKVSKCLDSACRRCPIPGDFNGDASSDLVWRHDGSGEIAVWLMDSLFLVRGSLTFPEAVADGRWKIVGTSDFDRDGMADFLWRHADSGQNAVWFMDGVNLAGGTFTSPAALEDVNWQAVGTGDFNLDGHPDILWRHATAGQNALWFMNGTSLAGGTFTTPSALVDLDWKVAGVGDFDQDRHPDILWHHQTSGQIVLWYMNGPTMTSGTFTTPPALADVGWKIAAVGLYDEGQQPDIVWRHQASGEIVVWLMDNATLTTGAYTDPSALEDLGWRLVGPR
jgi:hypothetical protein